MIGNLEPEERVYDCSVMSEGAWLGQLSIALEQLGWERGSNIAVEIGGTAVYEIEGAGTKWAPLKGTRKYNKDAFIVIKNLDRNPTIKSEPNPELIPHHLKEEITNEELSDS